MVDRLVGTILSSGQTDEPQAEPGWGEDAGSSPPAYWHWQHQWEQFHKDHGDTPSPVTNDGPVLSVVVPVHRPTLWQFRECVVSVVTQGYQHWELCLCDDGSADKALTAALAEFAADDRRIKVVALEKHQGISEATNRALGLASGEFVVLLDQHDVLAAGALAEIASAAVSSDGIDVIYSDEDQLDELARPCRPSFKPDWDPELLLSYPYLGHVACIRRELVRRIGGFRSEFDGGQEFDVMLRATEVARRVAHITKVLYHRRVTADRAAGDTPEKPSVPSAARRALEDALARRRIDALVEDGPFEGAFQVRRRIADSPTVSIIIPFRDQAALTVSCLDSLRRDPGYPIGEVILIDNGSTEPETVVLRRRLEEMPATRLIDYPGPFNWAAINNAAVATCDSDMVLFMNNDIEATSGGWLDALVEQGQLPEVGAVGARLIYPDGSIQHAGVVLGMQGIATHIFSGMPKGRTGYLGWDRLVRAYSAVTGACMLVRRGVFEELGGFDEAYPVAFNDVDFCLRLGNAGYRLVYTPHAELTHYESISRGLSGYSADYQAFLARWADQIREDDPCYNRNLSRFFPWCPLRGPGEDEEWLASIEALIPASPSEDAGG
jgi:GT2 family glycosyltransferase